MHIIARIDGSTQKSTLSNGPYETTQNAKDISFFKKLPQDPFAYMLETLFDI